MRDGFELGHIATAELGGCLFQRKIGLVIGTRPEAIKLAPVARALAAREFALQIYWTGQHPGLDLKLHGLDVHPVTPLNQPGLPDPVEHAERVAHSLSRVLQFRAPDMVLVQGDTSSALGGARAAETCKLPLGHVEAGLRTHDPATPWPEEPFRVEIDRLSHLLFAPTSTSAANLMMEHCRGEVHITGNSGIDALLFDLAGRSRQSKGLFGGRGRGTRVLVTCHRRENWGPGFERVARALVALASERRVEIEVILHPNPRVSEDMFRLLGHEEGVSLVPPLAHRAMLERLLRSDIILSDSGGIQEEAPTLGIPLLVLRDKTERPEGIEAGAMLLVGTDTDRIADAVRSLISNRAVRASMSRPSFPFGDGQAAPRIAALIEAWLEQISVSNEPLRA